MDRKTDTQNICQRWEFHEIGGEHQKFTPENQGGKTLTNEGGIFWINQPVTCILWIYWDECLENVADLVM